MPLIDTVTGEPWPIDKVNLALQVVREECRHDLWGRNAQRGIADFKVTTTIEIANTEGKTKEVVDVVKQHHAYTGADLQTLLFARWATFCSIPRSLKEFVASTLAPEVERRDALIADAEGIEKSLVDPSAGLLPERIGDDPDDGDGSDALNDPPIARPSRIEPPVQLD